MTENDEFPYRCERGHELFVAGPIPTHCPAPCGARVGINLSTFPVDLSRTESCADDLPQFPDFADGDPYEGPSVLGRPRYGPRHPDFQELLDAVAELYDDDEDDRD